MLGRINPGLAALLVASLALVPVGLQAAAVKADLPFTFSVNDVVLPPGDYLLSSDKVPGGLLIRGAARGVIVMTTPHGVSEDLRPRLVFHKYGDDYFLRQIWTSSGLGRDLAESRGERDRKEGKTGRAAARAEQVVVPIL